MKVPALILAGGKGRRLEQPIEKPLIDFLGKPFIDCVVEAVKASKSISTFYVVPVAILLIQKKRSYREGGIIFEQTPKGTTVTCSKPSSKIS
jgi:molybdopterin-guanine dinucleotide biosynthesis protein A